MSGKTSIQWATAVWNPTTGCTRVSAGCDNCYAFALHDRRHVAWKRGRMPKAAPQYHLPFSRVQTFPDRLDWPLRHRKPERIFVDSMADLFHEDVPDEYLRRVFLTMGAAYQHRFLVLTKRPQRMREFVSEPSMREAFTEVPGWPLPNVWLGTSVEDQKAADERIPHLLATPAAVRFLSCEPLLGPVDLTRLTIIPPDPPHGPGVWMNALTGHVIGPDDMLPERVDWVIIGGESGPRARPMDLAWARSLVEHCRAAGIAPFVKQLGARPQIDGVPMSGGDPDGRGPLVGLRDRKGGDIDEWPADLRVREFPR